MTDELKTCAAAFFRNKGKDTTTPNELIMTIAIELRWMDTTTASRFVKHIAAAKLVTEGANNMLRASKEIIDLDVPIGYRPSKEFLDSLKNDPVNRNKDVPEKKRSDVSAFAEMMTLATDNGYKRQMFVAESNKVSKKLDVDIEVAGLLVLREAGIDVSHLVDRVYDDVRMK